MKVESTPPTMAVRIPATGGNPLAMEIPRQSGSAIRKTRKPEVASALSEGVLSEFMRPTAHDLLLKVPAAVPFVKIFSKSRATTPLLHKQMLGIVGCP
jgi:hypothetical protein